MRHGLAKAHAESRIDALHPVTRSVNSACRGAGACDCGRMAAVDDCGRMELVERAENIRRRYEWVGQQFPYPDTAVSVRCHATAVAGLECTARASGNAAVMRACYSSHGWQSMRSAKRRLYIHRLVQGEVTSNATTLSSCVSGAATEPAASNGPRDWSIYKGRQIGAATTWRRCSVACTS